MLNQPRDPGQLFLDHVGFFVKDLKMAGAALNRLGFEVSDVNVQHNYSALGELIPTGTSNRLVMLKYGFLEALTATGRSALADQMRLGAERYEGLHLIALSHPDVVLECARLESAGFEMQAPLALRRLVVCNGQERLTNIQVLRTEPSVMREGRVQMLTNHTPELFWTPGSTEHTNKVDALCSIFLCVADPLEAAKRYSRYAGRESHAVDGVHTIELDRGNIVIADPRRTARIFPHFEPPSVPYMAAVALRSEQLSATRTALVEARVPFSVAQDDSLLVSPIEGLGAYVLFHGPTAFGFEGLLRKDASCLEH